MQDNEFTTSNNIFSGLIKFLRRAGHDKTEDHPAISEEDNIEELRGNEPKHTTGPGKQSVV